MTKYNLNLLKREKKAEKRKIIEINKLERTKKTHFRKKEIYLFRNMKTRKMITCN